jgi:predicted DNA-binding transcriptional regulator AlpA
MAHALNEDHHHGDIDDRLLPWPKVKDITGLSRTTAWRLQKAGDFPVPVVISPGRVGWRESELQAWKVSRTPRGELTVRPRLERSFAPQGEAHKKALAPPSPAPPQSQAGPLPTKQPPKDKQNGAAQLRFEF